MQRRDKRVFAIEKVEDSSGKVWIIGSALVGNRYYRRNAVILELKLGTWETGQECGMDVQVQCIV